MCAFVCAVLLQRGGGPAGGQDADHLPAHPVRAAHHPCTDRLTFPQRSVLQRVSGWKPQTENGMDPESAGQLFDCWLLKKGLKSQPFLGRKIAFVVSYNLRRLTRLVIAVVAVYGICIVTSADSDGRLLVFCLLSTQCCSSLRKRWARTEWPRGTTLPSPRSSTKSAHPVGEEPARQLSSCCLLRLVWWVEMLQTRAVTIKLYLSKKWGWIFMILTVFIYLIAYVRTRLKWE